MVRHLALADIVPKWFDENDGQEVFLYLKECMDNDYDVMLSFKDVHSLPSSFINAAFIELLSLYGFEKISSKLHFVDTSAYINKSLKERFSSELRRGCPGCRR